MDSNKFSRLIDAYFNGKLSDGEMKAFESKLNHDPMLRSEFDLQQDIINQLKELRRAELKARLNDVPVGGGFGEFLMGSEALKYAAGIATVSLIGLGTYFYFLAPDTSNMEMASFDIQPKSIHFESQRPADLDLEIEERIMAKEIVPFVTESEPLSESSDADDKVVPVAKAPVFTEPQIVEMFDEETDNIVEDIDDSTPLAPITEKAVSDLKVETKKKGKYDFHYRFYQNKLFLFGDFEGEPYEIIEINSKSGKKLFLYNDGAYSRINQSVYKITPLKVITDETLIKELDIIRENKAQ